MWSILSGLIGPVVSGISAWSERRDALNKAKLEADIAELKAKAELAMYKVKADVEWDLKWADAASTSWKDEWILILWSIPTIGLFIPFLRPYVMDGFEFLKTFDPEAPKMFMLGWAVIFAASYGMKQALAFMAPSKYASLITAMGNTPDDIPPEAVRPNRSNDQ